MTVYIIILLHNVALGLYQRMHGNPTDLEDFEQVFFSAGDRLLMLEHVQRKLGRWKQEDRSIACGIWYVVEILLYIKFKWYIAKTANGKYRLVLNDCFFHFIGYFYL